MSLKQLAEQHAATFQVVLGPKLGGGDCAEVYRVDAGPWSGGKHQYRALKVWRIAKAAKADGTIVASHSAPIQETHDYALRSATLLDLHDFMPRLLDSRPGASLIEYRAGVPLWKWAQTASPEAKADVAARLVRFVARMDLAGFRHGDLNSGNVLVSTRRVVTVIDPYPTRPETNMEGLAALLRDLITGERDHT